MGTGTVAAVEIATPAVEEPRDAADPDGLRLRLLPGDDVAVLSVTAFGDPRYYDGLVLEDGPLRFEEPPPVRGMLGAGSVHHHAWRMADEEEQLAWREHLVATGLHPTPVYDRKYFRSIYFRMPDGLLLELATEGPGFAVDEPAETLGAALALPDWLEAERPKLERVLTPIG